LVRLNWTEQASSDLKSIYDFISVNSPSFAKVYIQRIKNKTTLLKDRPKLGRVVPEFDKIELRELIFGNYRIVYKIISEEQLDILTIHHSARLLSLL